MQLNSKDYINAGGVLGAIVLGAAGAFLGSKEACAMKTDDFAMAAFKTIGYVAGMAAAGAAVGFAGGAMQAAAVCSLPLMYAVTTAVFVATVGLSIAKDPAALERLSGLIFSK